MSIRSIQEQVIEILRKNAVSHIPLSLPIHAEKYGRIDLTSQKGVLHPIPHAVIFDIYGTLFISQSGDISLADDNDCTIQDDKLQDLCRCYGLNISSVELRKILKEAIMLEHEKKRAQHIEYPEIEIRNIWRNLPQFSMFSDKNISLFAAEYESIVNPVCPMPHAIEVLQYLSSRIPLGIVSNAQFYTKMLFPTFFDSSTYNMGFHPQLCIYSYEEGYAKPSIKLFHILANRLSCLQPPIYPSHTLYVGNDMLNDIWAAQQVGFQTAIFIGDIRSFRPRSSTKLCNNLMADYVLDTLDKICVLFS